MRRPVLFAALTVLGTGVSLAAHEDEAVRVYYGTRNRSGSEGIYTGTFDPATGALSAPRLAVTAENPGFLALHPDRRHLYAVASGAQGDRIVAYAIEWATGTLREIGSRETGGRNPCHVSVGPKGRCVVYANYTGGSCGLIPLAEDGRLRPGGSFLQHRGGSGVVAGRQEAPHPHCARTDPSGRFVMVPDLGLDRVLVYRMAEDGTSMAPHDPPFAELPAGGGPRHLDFHPDGRWLYVNNELASSVSVFDLDPSTGSARLRQTLTTLPADASVDNSTAEIQVHPGGRFLYCSNRGHDSIAAFAIDPDTGALRSIGHAPSGGRTPRHFAISPDGRHLVAANHGSDDVATLGLDPRTGALDPTEHRIEVPHCICVCFAPTPEPADADG